MGQIRPLRPRNRHAVAPIMRKGGPHGKSTRAERAAWQRELRREMARMGRDDGVQFGPIPGLEKPPRFREGAFG